MNKEACEKVFRAGVDDMPDLKKRGVIDKTGAALLLENFAASHLDPQVAVWLLHNFKYSDDKASRIAQVTKKLKRSNVKPLDQIEFIATMAETLHLRQTDFRTLLEAILRAAEDALLPINAKIPGGDLWRIAPDRKEHPLFFRYRIWAQDPNFSENTIADLGSMSPEDRGETGEKILKALKEGAKSVRLSATDLETYDRVLATVGWFLSQHDRMYHPKNFYLIYKMSVLSASAILRAYQEVYNA